VKLITIDLETYYDQDFSLSKITTEEYIRSSQFEVIGVGVKIDNEPTQWASGPRKELGQWLKQFPFAESMVLAHNTMFDGAILKWHFGIDAKIWADTLCMARAIHGVEVGGSLKALAERYQIGAKGDEVIHAKGKRRIDFSDEELSRYGDYCLNDVDITYELFSIISKTFPRDELRLIDLTLRMFIDPVLEVDEDLMREHLRDIQLAKQELLSKAGADKAELLSNPKFAALLKEFGVVPPTKISPTTGKETLALAKNDEEFKALAEHPDVRVQTLVAARLGTKSTLEETRTERFLDISSRGALPIPLRYYAAHTGRWGGDDKINMQNLPSRGEYAGKIKRGILAPEGWVIIDSDSSQIEARTLAWLAGQDDLLTAFTNGEDVYKIMASAIYNKPVEEVTKAERFVGKTTILGAGYGMGAAKFQTALKSAGVEISLDEARHIINVYRTTNDKIVGLWQQAQTILKGMVNGEEGQLGREGVLRILNTSIRLPSGLMMRYDELKVEPGEKGPSFMYRTRKGFTYIYGGKVIENVCQAIARCIIGEQMLRIAKRYRVVMTVHDAIACIAPAPVAQEAMAYVMECMRWTPKWAKGLPLNCEAGFSRRYGDC
jgi:DNA polymerase I-like protein with 3'-5' exonuclease and polymerase domains